MTMQADYLDAHLRHWEDATTLYDAQRWPNADHLYGMAAECGLKRIMLAFGMPFDQTRDRPSTVEDQKHADAMWARFEAYRSGKFSGVDYSLSANNPFANWTASQRYAHRSDFDQGRTQSHQQGAEEVRKLVMKAQQEGFI